MQDKITQIKAMLEQVRHEYDTSEDTEMYSPSNYAYRRQIETLEKVVKILEEPDHHAVWDHWASNH